MPKMKMVESGTDPLENPIAYKRLQIPWLIVFGVVGLVAVLGLRWLSSANTAKAEAAAATKTALAPTQTSTPIMTEPSAARSQPTMTATGKMSGALNNVILPGTKTVNPTALLANLTPQVVTVVVKQPGAAYEVTRLVTNNIQVTQIVQQTVIITTTPMASATAAPTQTPWVIYVTQVVTATPTESPTATETQIIMDTATSIPTETATATAMPSETLAAYP